MNSISEKQVLDALSHVEEPDLKKDLVTLNMIQNIVIDNNSISFSVILTTPACPLKDMIEQACRNAIAHFIDKSVQVHIQMTAKVTGKPSDSLQHIKNIVLVSSGKGGVGKSTVSVNLALALAQSGAQVGLIDADIYGPSIPTMLDLLEARPQSVTLADGKHRIVPIEKYGIKILSLGFFASPSQPVPWRGPMASTAIKQLFNDAEWGELDYLIVDLPPGTGDIHITVTQSFTIAGAVIVTTPQKVALADARKGLGMFQMPSINVPILGVVENMSYFTPDELPNKKYYLFGKDGGRQLSEEFGVPFLGEIPLNPQIGVSGDVGKPIALEQSNILMAAFQQIAQHVAQQLSIQNAVSV